jgi:hypothetical protein
VAKNPPRAASKEDVQLARIQAQSRAKFSDNFFKFLRTASIAAAFVASVYFVMSGLQAFAGKETTLNSVVDWALKMDVSKAVAYAVASVCGGTVFWQRRTHKRTIAGMQDHVRQLEEKFDPNRGTSRLLPTGEPRKEDRDD